MSPGHDRRGFFRDLLRGAAEVVESLRVDAEPLEVPDYDLHETLPAAPAERFASAEDVRTLCAELEREAWADEAVALARTSIRLTRGGSGGSRLGGAPDLPSGYDWPEADGERLEFLAQLRLDELPASDLPARGTLLVFAARESPPAGERPCRVVLHDEPAERAGGGTLRELPVVPSLELTLPAEPEPLELDWEEAEVWGELCERLAALQGVELEDASAEYHALHRLLGYPDTLVAGMEVDAELVARGLDPSGGVDDPELERRAADWRLLVQLSSDAELGLTLGYYERLFVWVREDDLRAGRFDDVRAFVR